MFIIFKVFHSRKRSKILCQSSQCGWRIDSSQRILNGKINPLATKQLHGHRGMPAHTSFLHWIHSQLDRDCLPASWAFKFFKDSLWSLLNTLRRVSTSVPLWPGTSSHLIKIDNMNSDFKMYRYKCSKVGKVSYLTVN